MRDARTDKHPDRQTEILKTRVFASPALAQTSRNDFSQILPKYGHVSVAVSLCVRKIKGSDITRTDRPVVRDVRQNTRRAALPTVFDATLYMTRCRIAVTGYAIGADEHARRKQRVGGHSRPWMLVISEVLPLRRRSLG
ncbi:hypothetical protein EVAR_5354_1 [Eumeta japonica]|uniref:Uncharacterized protein n=1 Tax=Eumeta variegata TaxID=151549 RepID=A0A4C1TNZ5_EUMVA|nr:hypothetical protein EVAR_5354_1 [Eumeta japonica]